MFEKDGLAGEKYIKQVLNVKYKKPLRRYYKNTNYYVFLQKVIHKENEINNSYKQNKKERFFFKKRVI